MQKGDIVLVKFSFTDLSGNNLRPAIVLATSHSDLTVCFITTQLQWQEATDITIQHNSQNGIKKQSFIKVSKTATLNKALALGKIGSLDTVEIEQVEC
ncbi:MAG: type II toxin-antitoxin system PemK/MazF family toxin [Chitinophagaceae bacterium]